MIVARNHPKETKRRAASLRPGGLSRVPGSSRRNISGAERPDKWHARPLIWALTLFTALVALVFAVWLAWSVYILVRGAPTTFRYDPDTRCMHLSFSCGALTGFATSGLLLALASGFLLGRLYLILWRYRARARSESRELVPTAGTISDEVVGRDDLCRVVMKDLHDRRNRRPHVLVGGVGTGKTAVLVRLTEFLAENHAVPVPIRLRDAMNELDFEALARESFANEVDQYLLSAGEGEKIWRRLRNDGRIVVLADGLEEALVGSTAEKERDNVIRAAIRKAHQRRLPLVIASRPHDPLRGTEAAILVLEPLSYEAAMTYIGADGTGKDERRLDWIVETADVVEAPLYLQITRQLHLKGLLEHTSSGQDAVVDTRGGDRSKLRLALLQTWERALVQGHIREDVPLNWAERQATVEQLSALACVGLMRDRLDVQFEDLPGKEISAEVTRRLARIDEYSGKMPGVQNVDARLAAAWGAQLELVEPRGDSVRFPHSLIQAYLGSRLLGAALLDPAYRKQALRPPQPGREFLIALVLHSRAGPQDTPAGSRPGSGGLGAQARPPAPAASGQAQPELVCKLLRKAAGPPRADHKVLDMYAAALEIDCAASQPDHTAIAREIEELWPRIRAQDPRTLHEGKLGLVHRFGEAVRTIDERRRREDCPAEPAYPQLYAIACSDSSYPIQHAAAQEIGAGGDAAYRALRQEFAAPCPGCKAERSGKGPARAGGRRPPGRQAGVSGSSQAAIVSAWLAPLLVGSIGATGAGPGHKLLEEQARDDLARWLRHVGRDGRQAGELDLPISLEIALAQGFKYAANRRYPQLDARHEARTYLAEQALEMLKGAGYWFSQLTLIQALCLWQLSDGPKQGSKPEAIVEHWLDVAGRSRQPGAAAGPPHPFVLEACQLAVLALRTGRPQRYCWIDEAGVVAQVGSRSASPATEHRKHSLWIPPSAGWITLDRRAQQLVADVLLLLNLAERSDQPRYSDRHLERANRHDLPPCITRDRQRLDARRTVGMATSSAPGTNCADGCPFELCPYPPKGAQPRVEMSEAFCRRQQALLARSILRRRRRAPWQRMRSAQLARFWAEMADRARGPRPRSAADESSRGGWRG